jgi:hypothetical protein
MGSNPIWSKGVVMTCNCTPFPLSLLVGFVFGTFLGVFIGTMGANNRWEHQIRSGHGPKLIEAVMLEAKAEEIRLETR